ncbi:MAG: dihydroorotate dehydrogenase-like protein [Nocardioides sp.]
MDLDTTYLGLPLRGPLVASASPLTQSADRVIELVDAGVSAVVLHSLFEEQIEHPTPDPDAPHVFDNPSGPGAPDRYLDLIEECVRSVDVPVIASINGTSRGSWTSFARRMQDAGAAAVECNFYTVPEAVQESSHDVEARCMDVVHAIKQELDVPVTVKLTPYFSSFGQFAMRLAEVGADGLVLFNRFLQPHVDVQAIAVSPVIGLSHSSDARLPQTWIALLRDYLTISLAGTGGVETADDLAAYLLAGADVVECASVFLRHGPERAAGLLDDLSAWGDEHGFSSVDAVRGKLAVPWPVDIEDYSREGYVAALQVARRSYRHP